MQPTEEERKSPVGKILVKAIVALVIISTLLTIYFVAMLVIEGNSMR